MPPLYPTTEKKQAYTPLSAREGASTGYVPLAQREGAMVGGYTPLAQRLTDVATNLQAPNGDTPQLPTKLVPWLQNATDAARLTSEIVSSPGENIVKPGLEALKVPTALAAGAGFAVDVASPFPGGKVKKFEEAAKFAQEAVKADKAGMVTKYINQFGSNLNTDQARELFPHYRDDRSLSAAVHEPSSEIVKAAYDNLLQTQKGTGVGEAQNTVLFTSGGTGAGKSSSLSNAHDYSIVYDTNMAKADSGAEKIDKALSSGYDVHVNFTYADVKQALERALKRSESMAKQKGSGRTVPVEEHIATHYGSQDAFPVLFEKYKDNPNVKFTLVDNSGDTPVRVDNPLAFLDKMRYSRVDEKELLTELQQQITKAHSEGRISEQTKNGFYSGSSESTVGQTDGNSQAQHSKQRADVLKTNSVVTGGVNTLAGFSDTHKKVQ